MEIWNRHFECMDREELRSVQEERRRKTVERIYFYVPYYRKKMQEKGLVPGNIQSLDDLSKLPFTTKNDLRDNYPFGLFASPLSEIVRLHASSGTTGKPTVVGYSRRDIETWSEVMTLRQKIQQNLESSLGLSIKITLVEPKTLERSEGKSNRVIDRRSY